MKSRAKLNRQAMVVGFVVSAFLHGFLILVYSLSIEDWYLGDTITVQETTSGSLDGIRVVTITETDIPQSESDIPEEVIEDVVLEIDEVRPQLTQEAGQDNQEADLRQRAAEILRVRSSDERLWR